ncbi:MAG: hypothetical protein JXO22_14235, partial [Phycisphaerae bacterium]|nr:hypothetical protein [Phycisphaerae bacterium]
GDAAARFTASWFVVPVCWCFVVTAVISGWPMQLRFELSRAAFEREVQTILSGNSTAKSRTIGSGAMTMIYLNKPVGLYFVDTVCVSPTGMSFTTNGVGLSTFGFSCNTSAPVNTPGLSGRWRTFSHDK